MLFKGWFIYVTDLQSQHAWQKHKNRGAENAVNYHERFPTDCSNAFCFRTCRWPKKLLLSIIIETITHFSCFPSLEGRRFGAAKKAMAEVCCLLPIECVISQRLLLNIPGVDRNSLHQRLLRRSFLLPSLPWRRFSTRMTRYLSQSEQQEGILAVLNAFECHEMIT